MYDIMSPYEGSPKYVPYQYKSDLLHVFQRTKIIKSKQTLNILTDTFCRMRYQYYIKLLSVQIGNFPINNDGDCENM